MTQIEMETMTAIRNYCRQNTPGRKTARLALALELARSIVYTGMFDANAEDYPQKVAKRAMKLADALMADCEKGDDA